MTVWALDQLFVALDAKSGYSVRKTEDPASPRRISQGILSGTSVKTGGRNIPAARSHDMMKNKGYSSYARSTEPFAGTMTALS